MNPAAPPRPTSFFGAIPGRALADHDLTGTDMRVLGVYALHDRMSQNTNGQGTWANLTTIARETRCHVTEVSRSTVRLVERGYLVQGVKDGDRRCKVYRVRYDNASDNLIELGKAPDTWGRTQAAIGTEPKQSPEILGDANSQAAESIEEPDPNIFRRNGSEDILQKQPRKYSAKAGTERSPNGVLAIIQRQLKSRQALDYEAIRDTLTNILEQAEGGSMTYGWADRLLTELG